jgi:hypothetical protein
MHTQLLHLSSKGHLYTIVNPHTLLRLFVQGAILTIANAYSPLKTCRPEVILTTEVNNHLLDLPSGVILTMDSANSPLGLAVWGHLDHLHAFHGGASLSPGVR